MPFPIYMSFAYAQTHTHTHRYIIITLLRVLRTHTYTSINVIIYNIYNTVGVGLRLNFLTYFDLFNKSFSRVLHNSNGNWTIAI